MVHNNTTLLDILEQVYGEWSSEVFGKHQQGASVQSVRKWAKQMHERRKSTGGWQSGVPLLVRLVQGQMVLPWPEHKLSIERRSSQLRSAKCTRKSREQNDSNEEGSGRQGEGDCALSKTCGGCTGTNRSGQKHHRPSSRQTRTSPTVSVQVLGRTQRQKSSTGRWASGWASDLV